MGAVQLLIAPALMGAQRAGLRVPATATLLLPWICVALGAVGTLDGLSLTAQALTEADSDMVWVLAHSGQSVSAKAMLLGLIVAALGAAVQGAAVWAGQLRSRPGEGDGARRSEARHLVMLALAAATLAGGAALGVYAESGLDGLLATATGELKETALASQARYLRMGEAAGWVRVVGGAMVAAALALKLPGLRRPRGAVELVVSAALLLSAAGATGFAWSADADIDAYIDVFHPAPPLP